MAKEDASKMIVGGVFILLYCIVTASSTVLVGVIEHEIRPMLLSFYSFLISLIVFNLLHIRNFQTIKLFFTQYKRDTLLVNISTMVMWVSVFFGLQYLSPAIFLAVFFGAMPIATIFMTRKEHKPAALRKVERLFGGLISLVMLVLIVDDLMIAVSLLRALLCIGLAILSGSFAAHVNIIGHRFAKRNLTATQVLSQRFYLLVIVSGMILLFVNAHWILSGKEYLSAVIVAIASVMVPLFLLQKSLEKVDPVYVSFLTPFVPVFSFFIQLLSPHYQFQLVELIILLVLSGVILYAAIVKARIRRLSEDH